MSTSEQARVRTRMFARTLGPFFTIVPTTVAIRGSYMRTLFTEFKANPMWPWLFGAILLMFGLVELDSLTYEPLPVIGLYEPAAVVFCPVRGL